MYPVSSSPFPVISPQSLEAILSQTDDSISLNALNDILNEWRMRSDPEEKRSEAANKIMAFYIQSDSIAASVSPIKLALDSLQLKTLPNIFSHTPFLNIEEINLGNNSLTELPEVFSRLHKLKKLNVQGNQFPSFPNIVTKLSTLKSLNLSYLELREIPDSIAGLYDLEELYLSDNRLVELPRSIGMLQKLKKLDIAGNLLERLPETFYQCVELQYLKLAENDSLELSDSIKFLQNLETLDFTDNKHQKLPHCISELRNLKRLYVAEYYFVEDPQKINYLPSQVEVIIRKHSYSVPELKTMFLKNSSREISSPSELSESCQITFSRIENFDFNLDSWIAQVFSGVKFSSIEDEQVFRKKFTSLLEQVNNCPNLKKVFLTILQNLDMSSQNQIVTSILELDLSCQTELLDHTAILPLANFLQKGQWIINTLKYTTTNIKSCFLSIQKQYQIPISEEVMIYFKKDQIIEEDLDEIHLKIREAQTDQEAFLNFLIEKLPVWKDALRLNYPCSWKEIIEQREESKEKAQTAEDVSNLEKKFHENAKALSYSIINKNLPPELPKKFLEACRNCLNKFKYNPQVAVRNFIQQRNNLINELSLDLTEKDNPNIDLLLSILLFFFQNNLIGEKPLLAFLLPTTNSPYLIQSLGYYIDKLLGHQSGIRYIQLLLDIFKKPYMRADFISMMSLKEKGSIFRGRSFNENISSLLYAFTKEYKAENISVNSPQAIFLNNAFALLSKLHEYETNRGRKDPKINRELLVNFEKLKTSYPTFVNPPITKKINYISLAEISSILKICENASYIRSSLFKTKKVATEIFRSDSDTENKLHIAAEKMDKLRKSFHHSTTNIISNLLQLTAENVSPIQSTLSQSARETLEELRSSSRGSIGAPPEAIAGPSGLQNIPRSGQSSKINLPSPAPRSVSRANEEESFSQVLKNLPPLITETPITARSSPRKRRLLEDKK